VALLPGALDGAVGLLSITMSIERRVPPGSIVRSSR
jgi:hypothetical protein